MTLMSGSSTAFIVLLLVWCVASLALTALLLYWRKPKRQLFRIVVVFSICAFPLTAISVGSFYSHGFIIPWYLYGLAIALSGLLCSSMLIVAWPTPK
jgi:hypothetical protein